MQWLASDGVAGQDPIRNKWPNIISCPCGDGKLTRATQALAPVRPRGPWKVLCDNQSFLHTRASKRAMVKADLNPVEKMWTWLRRRLHALDRGPGFGPCWRPAKLKWLPGALLQASGLHAKRFWPKKAAWPGPERPSGRVSPQQRIAWTAARKMTLYLVDSVSLSGCGSWPLHGIL